MASSQTVTPSRPLIIRPASNHRPSPVTEKPVVGLWIREVRDEGTYLVIDSFVSTGEARCPDRRNGIWKPFIGLGPMLNHGQWMWPGGVAAKKIFSVVSINLPSSSVEVEIVDGYCEVGAGGGR